MLLCNKKVFAIFAMSVVCGIYGTITLQMTGYFADRVSFWSRVWCYLSWVAGFACVYYRAHCLIQATPNEDLTPLFFPTELNEV